MADDDSHRYDLLDRLAEEFADRLRRGERPTLEEYTDRFPDLADDIRELFPALIKVEKVEEIRQDRDEAEDRSPLPSQVGDYRIIRQIGHGGMGIVYEAEQISLGRRVALKVLPWQIAKNNTLLERFRREARASARLHHTNIVPVFEVGQDGEIAYYAMQFIQGQTLHAVIEDLRLLRSRFLRERGRRVNGSSRDEIHRDDSARHGIAADRRVALSLLTGRFHRSLLVESGADTAAEEAEVALNADRSDSVPSTALATSVVMPGGAELSSVDSGHRAFHRGVAQIGRQVAGALAYAHARGVVHRDVKPSNLLLDTDGVVWVSDFGLAKIDDEALTGTGDVVGTLRYMAPERLRGEGDARADIYSLGLTLYELLLLRPAFDSPDRVAQAEQIRTAEPPRPRSIDPRIPRDLETIVLKAVEKDPRQRYATADAMAEDLRRFLDDEPIQARRVNAPERYLRWARRNPIIATLGGALLLLLLGATAVSMLAYGRMAALASTNEAAAQREREANQATEMALGQARVDRREAERQRERAEQRLYIARIGQAESALRLFDYGTARGLLDQCLPAPGKPNRCGWEWSYLDQWCSPELRTISLPTAAFSHCVAVSPDGRLLAVGCAEPYARQSGRHRPAAAFLISLPDGIVRHELSGHTDWVSTVAFDRDGKRLATVGAEGTIRFWNATSGLELRALRLKDVKPGFSDRGEVTWSPDGRWLAGAITDGTVRIWDAETGRETNHSHWRARLLAWSPDGTRIASSDDAGMELRRWDSRTGLPGEPIRQQSGASRLLAWSPDGQRLAAACKDNDAGKSHSGLSVWDSTSGKRIFRAPSADELSAVAFSRDGSRLSTGSDNGIIRVFDAADGRELVTIFPTVSKVTGLAFSPDGLRLYAAGWTMLGVKVFDPDRDPRGRGVPGWISQLAALTFDREGLRVLGAGWTAGELVSADPVTSTASVDSTLPVTDIVRFPRSDFAFSADARRLAAPTRQDRTVVGIWDVVLGRQVATLEGSGGVVSAVAFRPDGQVLAIAVVRPIEPPIVTLWHISSGRRIGTIPAKPGPVSALAFSADGHKLAAGGGATQDRHNGWVAAWDVETGASLGVPSHVGTVMSVAFHPDGTRLAVADEGESTVHLWNLATGTWIANPGLFGANCVEFTLDGTRLAAVGIIGNVYLYDAQTGDQVLVLRGFGEPSATAGYTPRLSFSPDGSRIAGQFPGLLNLWDLAPREYLKVEPNTNDLAGWLRRSRALAEVGDIDKAESAFGRAREISDRNPSPWIEHALLLWHRGDSPEAHYALERAMEALPDDPVRWVDLGRLLASRGRSEESTAVLSKARALCERRLSQAPDDETAAAALAEMLPEPDESWGWTILQPDVMTSAAGARLTRLPDGSVLAGGPSPDVDAYGVEAVTDLVGITALRLEVLPDPSLPHHGPGRNPDNGNFALDAIRLSAVHEPPAQAPCRISLIRAYADYARVRHPSGSGVTGALDNDPLTFWEIWPQCGRAHHAVFQAAEPFGNRAGTRLRIELSFAPRSKHHAIGRFRLWVTDRPFPLFDTGLKRIKTDPERDARTRLGAAYALLSDWAKAATVLERAGLQPGTSALDRFLLALARHHLGRRDEARLDCDRALKQWRGEAGDEESRVAALEALVTIQGMGIDAAESALLDFAFPADSFAR